MNQQILYAIDGGVAGITENAKTTISHLNLGIDKLERLRENAIAGFLYEDEEKTVLISRADAQQLLAGYQAEVEGTGLLTPFIVAIMQSLDGIA